MRKVDKAPLCRLHEGIIKLMTDGVVGVVKVPYEDGLHTPCCRTAVNEMPGLIESLRVQFPEYRLDFTVATKE